MENKSIADLKRYKTFLKNMLAVIEQSASQNVFDRGEVDRYNMGESLSKIDSIRSTLIILEQEINISSMSNSVIIDKQEYSIYQVNLMRDNANEMILLFNLINNKLVEGKEKHDIIRFQQQTISKSVIDSEIDNLYKKVYSLTDKIERAEAKTIVEIDMSSLIPISLSSVQEDSYVKVETSS